jgi:plastocyanin
MRVPISRTATVALVCTGAVTLSIAGAFARDHPRTVAAVGGAAFKPNKSFTIDFRWERGKISVRSGDTVTWVNRVDQIVAEPHTITIADKDALPETIEELFACGGPGTACEPASGHVDDQFNPIPGKEVLNAGPPGLNQKGDSLLLAAPEAGRPTPTISATVSAPPGAKLVYLCAIHPWMQGEIDVKRNRGRDDDDD